MTASNALGDEILMFVVGKLLNPRCFKGVKNKSCLYRVQKKAWTNSDLFEESVHGLDRKFQRENRRIALIVDNCPAHPDGNDLKAIELVFLPSNTTCYLVQFGHWNRNVEFYQSGALLLLLKITKRHHHLGFLMPWRCSF